MTEFLLNDHHIYYIEADQHIKGNIIFCQSRTIKTTNGTHTVTLAGARGNKGYQNGAGLDAKFNKIHGIEQMVIESNDIVYIADSRNHVIRSLNRTDNTVSLIAGKPKVNGTMDGHALNAAEFDYPYDIIQDVSSEHLFFVTTIYGKSLRIYDSSSLKVTTIFNFSTYAYAMVWHNQDLFITCRNQIYKISNQTSSLFLNLNLGTMRFPSDMIRLDVTSMLLAVDGSLDRMLFINLESRQLSVLCLTINGSESATCEFDGLRSIAIYNNSIYISVRGKILTGW